MEQKGKAVICLTMIVKNEAEIIERCLQAAKPFITHWSIMDTGSTDNTREIIRSVMVGVPGQLVEEPWVNFGVSRSRSVMQATGFLAAQGCDFRRSYCLLLDADHQLEDHGFAAEQLSAASYMLVQRSGYYRYPNTRLIRCDQSWHCVGVTHEFWAAYRPTDTSQGTLETLEIIDHEDGGTRSEKLERDEALLRQGLVDEPDNERYHFYLAQTLAEASAVQGDAGKRAEAIALYAKRASMGGYGEERWMAQYRMAQQLLVDGQQQQGEAELARAWQQAPHRAEPLYWLARHHRENSRSVLAMLYAERAAAIPQPPAESLFVENHAFAWGPQEEIAISAFYTREFDKGRRANELCIVCPHTRELALKNQCFYATPLKGVTESGQYEPIADSLKTFDYYDQEKREWSKLVYRQGTTSISGDVISTRVMSYDQKGGRDFWSRCPDKKFRTETVLDQNGKRWLVDSSIEQKQWPQLASILGLEDWRLFRHNGRLWFVANCCTTPLGSGSPQVAIGRLSEDLQRVDRILAPRYAGSSSWCEKNWQPLPQEVSDRYAPPGDWIGIVYAYDPFTIIFVEAETGDVVEHTKGPEVCGKRWRGSAPPIDLGGLLVGIVHDVSYFETGNIYTHRFIAMNPALELVAYSPSFIFQTRGIEYSAGMQVDPDGLVRILYTVEEHESHWLRIPVARILEQLVYEPATGKECINVECY